MSRRDGPPFAAAALLLAGSLAGLALAEAGARLWERAYDARYYRPHQVGPPQVEASLYKDSYDYGYEPIPFTDGYNALGFRNPDYPPRKAPEVFRVMLAGDSLAASYGMILQDELERLLPPGRRPELWNAGVGGYSLGQYVRRLRRKGLPHAPDLMILFHCLNDLDGGAPVLVKTRSGFIEALWLDAERHARLPGARLLWTRSALYRLAALTALRREPRGGAPGERRQEARALSALEGLLDEAGGRAPVVSVLFPLLMPEALYRPGWQRDGREALPRVLKNAGIPVLDLSPLIPEAERVGLRSTPRDYVHMQAEKSRPYMAVIARWLAGRGLLPKT